MAFAVGTQGSVVIQPQADPYIPPTSWTSKAGLDLITESIQLERPPFIREGLGQAAGAVQGIRHGVHNPGGDITSEFSTGMMKELLYYHFGKVTGPVVPTGGTLTNDHTLTYSAPSDQPFFSMMKDIGGSHDVRLMGCRNFGMNFTSIDQGGTAFVQVASTIQSIFSDLVGDVVEAVGPVAFDGIMAAHIAADPEAIPLASLGTSPDVFVECEVDGDLDLLTGLPSVSFRIGAGGTKSNAFYPVKMDVPQTVFIDDGAGADIDSGIKIIYRQGSGSTSTLNNTGTPDEWSFKVKRDGATTPVYSNVPFITPLEVRLVMYQPGAAGARDIYDGLSVSLNLVRGQSIRGGLGNPFRRRVIASGKREVTWGLTHPLDAQGLDFVQKYRTSSRIRDMTIEFTLDQLGETNSEIEIGVGPAFARFAHKTTFNIANSKIVGAFDPMLDTPDELQPAFEAQAFNESGGDEINCVVRTDDTDLTD